MQLATMNSLARAAVIAMPNADGKLKAISEAGRVESHASAGSGIGGKSPCLFLLLPPFLPPLPLPVLFSSSLSPYFSSLSPLLLPHDLS